MNNKFFSTVIFALLLTSCSSGSLSRYQQSDDSIPTRAPTKSELQSAIPRAESHSRGGNKPYQVFGKNYQVLPSAKGFEATGLASWYGEKFHGHLTSNGEIYDMYAMSAAHKNLPLPTYVRVTNLANNKSVIVRVNDRGPFHQSRLIDLSYSAAYKLDMLKSGTAKVKIVAITDFSPPPPLVKPINKNIKEHVVKVPKQSGNIQRNAIQPVVKLAPTSHTYIQVFATSKNTLAQDTAKNVNKTISKILNNKKNYQITTPKFDQVYKVVIGPIKNSNELNDLLLKLKENGYPNAFRKNI